jgi:hypothetical protein
LRVGGAVRWFLTRDTETWGMYSFARIFLPTIWIDCFPIAESNAICDADGYIVENSTAGPHDIPD